jgi:SPP1 gp7 family putative phage head morphogenesis protein
LSQAKASGALLLPTGVTAEVVFPTSADGFQKALEYHDLAIAKALLVPNLMGVSNAGQTGAYSQSQTQLETFAWTLQADAKRLESVVDRQIFRDLQDQNWGDKVYAKFKFKPLSTEKLRWFIDTWTKLISGGAVIQTEADETRLREILEMPPRDPDAEPLIDPEVATGREHELGTKDKEHELGEKSKDNDVKRSIDEDKKRATDPILAGEKAKDRAAQIAGAKAAAGANGGKKPFDKKPVKHTSLRDARLVAASARERVDFAVLDRKQAGFERALSHDLAMIVTRSVDKELGDEAALKSLTDENTDDIGQFQLHPVAVGKIKAMAQKALMESWVLGREHAQREVRKSRKVVNLRFADLRDKAAQYIDAQAFRMAGNIADGARSIIQQELLNSVKVGRSPPQTRTAIWERLVAKGFSSREAVRSVEPADSAVMAALDALWVDSEEQAAAYLNTLARTSLFESMNEARYAEFSDPALGDFVVALRYSSVLDERTTEICEALHDHVWTVDSDNWETYRPPNHYNCRSVLVPITQLDVEDGLWNGEESDVPDVEPQAGFK